jgi:outer membrane protein assembly factor BamD
MKKNIYTSLISVLTILLLTSCSQFAKLQKTATVDEKYEAALNYYKKADYYHAGLLFEEITPLLKGATQAELSQFYNAYCNYHQGLYNMSQYLFKNFYETFARSDFAQEATYMHAYSLYKDSPNSNLDQTNTLSAISALQDFVNTYPDSPFREECTKLILELRDKLEIKAFDKVKLYYRTSEFNIANYRSSVVAVNNFIKEFPASKYNEELNYLRVDAQYNLAKLSFKDKQKERYEDLNKYYLLLVDKYPKSNYISKVEKYYEAGQKELLAIAAADKADKEAKAAAQSSKSGKLSTSSN